MCFNSFIVQNGEVGILIARIMLFIDWLLSLKRTVVLVGFDNVKQYSLSVHHSEIFFIFISQSFYLIFGKIGKNKQIKYRQNKKQDRKDSNLALLYINQYPAHLKCIALCTIVICTCNNNRINK